MKAFKRVLMLCTLLTVVSVLYLSTPVDRLSAIGRRLPLSVSGAHLVSRLMQGNADIDKAASPLSPYRAATLTSNKYRTAAEHATSENHSIVAEHLTPNSHNTAAEHPTPNSHNTAAEHPTPNSHKTAAEHPTPNSHKTATANPTPNSHKTAREHPTPNSHKTAAKQPTLNSHKTAAEHPTSNSRKTAADIPKPDNYKNAEKKNTHISYGTVQKRLIILAYMRSGSTMTGSLFNKHPDVFYWFEPLHAMGLDHGFQNRHIEKWIKRRQFRSSDDTANNVSALLNCDVSNVYPKGLKDDFLNRGESTRPFRNCFLNASLDLWLTNSSVSWDSCVSNLTTACLKNYRVVSMKTIRFSTSRAVELMRKDPNLSVLHLVRDPRGILESRRRLGFANFSDLQAEAYNLCKDISDDLNISQSIAEHKVRQRYMLVRYEDVATSPVLAAKLFYDFMGLKPAVEGMRQAEDVTRRAPGKRTRCPTCQAQVVNSTARSQEWRHNVRLSDVQIISDQCSDLMISLGYRVRFQDEGQLLDPGISAVEKPLVKLATSGFQRLS